jgi:F-type H+-transporting ATPase subunit beta
LSSFRRWTEQFTGLRGKLVDLEDALDGCERILGDEFEDYPESALYMIGAVDEAKEKAESDRSGPKVSPRPESRSEVQGDAKPAPVSKPNGASETPSKPERKPRPKDEPGATAHES